ncbi:hypothetical protein Lser_V15G17458 [Lactuca serriola]
MYSPILYISSSDLYPLTLFSLFVLNFNHSLMAHISPNYVTLVSEVTGNAIIEGWFMDSSATVHVCHSLHKFISYYPITQVEVVIGNNVKEPIQVIIDEGRFIVGEGHIQCGLYKLEEAPKIFINISGDSYSFPSPNKTESRLH